MIHTILQVTLVSLPIILVLLMCISSVKKVFTFLHFIDIINYPSLLFGGFMNIKDYTLKIGYRIDGKDKEESVEYALVKNDGYDGEDIRICDFGDADHVKIVVSAKSKIELKIGRAHV